MFLCRRPGLVHSSALSAIAATGAQTGSKHGICRDRDPECCVAHPRVFVVECLAQQLDSPVMRGSTADAPSDQNRAADVGGTALERTARRAQRQPQGPGPANHRARIRGLLASASFSRSFSSLGTRGDAWRNAVRRCTASSRMSECRLPSASCRACRGVSASICSSAFSAALRTPTWSSFNALASVGRLRRRWLSPSFFARPRYVAPAGILLSTYSKPSRASSSASCAKASKVADDDERFL